MTWDEYYEYLEVLWEAVDKNNLEDIKEYNRLRRDLRKTIEEEQ